MAYILISSIILGYSINCRSSDSSDTSGATQAVALEISKAFDRVWHAGLFHKLKC